MRRTSLLAASVIALTMALPVAQASAAPATGASEVSEVSAMACDKKPGFRTDLPIVNGSLSAYYNHCTREPYAVKITIEYKNGSRSEDCVQPNDDKFLGWTSYVHNAWYNGKLC